MEGIQEMEEEDELKSDEEDNKWWRVYLKTSEQSLGQYPFKNF